MFDNLAVGMAICSLRGKNGLKAKELAELSGLTIYDISRLENGQKRLDFLTAVRLSEAMKIDINDLIAAFRRVDSQVKNSKSEEVIKAANSMRQLKEELMRAAAGD